MLNCLDTTKGVRSGAPWACKPQDHRDLREGFEQRTTERFIEGRRAHCAPAMTVKSDLQRKEVSLFHTLLKQSGAPQRYAASHLP